MKNSISNFGEFALSRSEMKSISGGCNAKCSVGGGAYEYSSADSSMSQAAAIAAQQACTEGGGTGYWCCSSCGSWGIQ